MKNWKIALACVALSACGTKQLGSTKPNIVAPKDTPIKPPGTCPATAPASYHTVTVTFPRNLPVNGIGVKFPAEAGLRANGVECATHPTQPNGVVLSYKVTATNTIVVRIDHNNAFTGTDGVTRLPNSQAIQIVQSGCDGTNATNLYLSPANAPPAITWTYTRPGGPSCAEALLGSAETAAPEVEEVSY